MNRIFYRIASLCSIGYVLITVLCGWMRTHIPTSSSFDEFVELRTNPWLIMVRLLVLFSMFLSLVIFVGIAARLYKKAPVLTFFAFCSGFVFVLTEILWRTVDYFAVMKVWTAQYAVETDLTIKASLKTLITSYDSVVNALYFILMSGILIALILFGFAAWSRRLFDRVFSIALFINGLRLLLRILSMHFGVKGLSDLNVQLYYPLNIIMYLIIAIWLWRFTSANGNMDNLLKEA